MERTTSAVAGAFPVAAVPIERRMPARTAFTASLPSAAEASDAVHVADTAALRRVMVEAFRPALR